MTNRSAYILAVTVCLLVALGVTMLCSTSVFGADARADDLYYEVKRQVMWIVLGVAGCILMAAVDYRVWQRTTWIWYGLAIIALALCFIPGIGVERNGETRWINLGFTQVQPSEFAKLAAVMVLAWWFARHVHEEKKFFRGFVFPGLIVGVLALLILFEVDMGTTLVIGAAAFTLMFVAGSRIWYLIGSGMVAATALGFMIRMIPNRWDRIIALTDLEKYQRGVGMQQYRSVLAFGSGGIDGMGLGNGLFKMLYLPFAHTDFIFPMVGEELGLGFTLAVVLAFVLIVVCGLSIALHAPDRFGQLLGIGIVCLIAFQGLLNIGVTTAVLPNTGLPLPFVSYGGSNLVACLLGVGILLNIYRQGNHREHENFPRIMRNKVTPRL
ncbi:MAG: putative peptidoglycan glycosyltransferase FtsW [Verrucomicrobiota bacterium]